MNTLAILGWMPSGGELIVILLALLLLFGAKRIPDLARSLGRSLSEFKKGREEGSKGGDPGRPEEDKKSGDEKGRI